MLHESLVAGMLRIEHRGLDDVGHLVNLSIEAPRHNQV